MADKIMTPEFRAAFAQVFQPKGIKGDKNSKEKFSVTMLYAKGADLSKLKAAARQVAVDKWGEEGLKKIGSKLKLPFKDQTENAERYAGFEEGAVYMQASSDTKPGCVDAKVQDIIDPEDFYSGCYARATVQPYAWEHPTGGKGVSFGLLNIQKLRDGERLGGGRSKASDDFEAVGEDLPSSDAVWD